MIRFTCEKEFKICDSTTLRKLASMRRHGVMTDLTLICGTSLYPIHKLVLAASSTHFNDNYFTKKNGKVEKQSTILITEVNPVDIENLIKYMYSGQLVIPENELPGLMRVSDSLKIDGLKEKFAVRVPAYNLVPLKSSAKKGAVTLPRNDMKLRSQPTTSAGSQSRRNECQEDDYQTPNKNYRRSSRNGAVRSQSRNIVSKTPCRNEPLNDRDESVESRARSSKRTHTGRRQTTKVVTIRDNSFEKHGRRKTTGTAGLRENSSETSARRTTNVRKSARKSNFHFQPIMSSTLLMNGNNTPRPYTVEKLKTPAPAMPAKDTNNSNAQLSRLSRRSRPRISSVAQKASSDNASAMHTESYLDRKTNRSKLHNETVIVYTPKVNAEKTPLKRDRIGEAKSARTPCKSTPAHAQIRTAKTPKAQTFKTPAQRTSAVKAGKSAERSIHKFKPRYSSTLISEVGGVTGRLSGLGKLRSPPPSPKNPRPLKRLKWSENPIPIETEVKSRLSRGRPKKSCRNTQIIESVDLISTEEEHTKNVQVVGMTQAFTGRKSALSRGRPSKSYRNPEIQDTNSTGEDEKSTKSVGNIVIAVTGENNKSEEKVEDINLALTVGKSALSRGRPRKPIIRKPEIEDTNSTEEEIEPTKTVVSVDVALIGEKGGRQKKLNNDVNLAVENRRYNTRASKRAQLQSEEEVHHEELVYRGRKGSAKVLKR